MKRRESLAQENLGLDCRCGRGQVVANDQHDGCSKISTAIVGPAPSPPQSTETSDAAPELLCFDFTSPAVCAVLTMPPSDFSQPIINIVSALWPKREAPDQVTDAVLREKVPPPKLTFFVVLGRPSQWEGSNAVQHRRSAQVVDYSSR